MRFGEAEFRVGSFLSEGVLVHSQSFKVFGSCFVLTPTALLRSGEMHRRASCRWLMAISHCALCICDENGARA